MTSRYYYRDPFGDEQYPLLRSERGRYRNRRRRHQRRGRARRRWPTTSHPDYRYRRIAFDAGEPEHSHRRGWRRFADQIGGTIRDAGEALRETGGAIRRRFTGETAPNRDTLDYDEDEEGQRATQMRRRLAHRYKEPIVGIALAGAAVPIAAGAGGGPETAMAPMEDELSHEATITRPTPRGSIEEKIEGRLAELQDRRARNAMIEDAVRVYGISQTLAERIYDTAVDNDIEPELAFGLVKTESAFDLRAVSNVGARGLTQVMPRTARWLRPGTTNADLFDRDINLNLGFSYLRDMIDKYQGDVRLALLAYNRGPGTVDRVLDAGGDPDNGYADLVFEGYTDLG